MVSCVSSVLIRLICHVIAAPTGRVWGLIFESNLHSAVGVCSRHSPVNLLYNWPLVTFDFHSIYTRGLQPFSLQEQLLKTQNDCQLLIYFHLFLLKRCFFPEHSPNISAHNFIFWIKTPQTINSLNVDFFYDCIRDTLLLILHNAMTNIDVVYQGPHYAFWDPTVQVVGLGTEAAIPCSATMGRNNPWLWAPLYWGAPGVL